MKVTEFLESKLDGQLQLVRGAAEMLDAFLRAEGDSTKLNRRRLWRIIAQCESLRSLDLTEIARQQGVPDTQFDYGEQALDEVAQVKRGSERWSESVLRMSEEFEFEGGIEDVDVSIAACAKEALQYLVAAFQYYVVAFSAAAAAAALLRVPPRQS
jgi:hypothetical protein